MAKIPRGILGAISGKIGDVVGAILRGEGIIRMKPKKSTKPPQESQINQRNKFSLGVEFMRNLTKVVDLGFAGYDAKMSTSNLAVQELYDTAITGTAPDFQIDYPKVKLSKGNLEESNTMSMKAGTTGSAVDFTWDFTEEHSPAEQLLLKSDNLTVVFYNPSSNRFVTFVECALRSAGTRSLKLPAIHSGTPLHVWIFFTTAKRQRSSNTQYLGTVTMVK